MKRWLLIALLCLIPLSSHAALKAVASGGSSSSSSSSYVTSRVPTVTDDSTLGYATSQLWNYNNNFWKSIYAGSGDANWQQLNLSSAPLCDLVPTCKVAYGVYRLKSSYTGYAFRVVRASDSAIQDIPFDVNGFANWGLVDTFCSTTTCTIPTWYDQSGGAFDLTQATVGNQPRIYNGIVGNTRAISFDGHNAQRSMSNTSVTFTDRLNISILVVATTAGSGSNAGNTFLDIGNPTAKFTVFSNPSTSSNLAYNAGSGQTLNAPLRAATPTAFMFVDTAGTVTAQQNNLLTTGAGTATSSAATGILVGGTTLVGYPGRYDAAAYVVWDSALSSANQQNAMQSIYQTVGIAPQINDNVFAIGDSITCCTTAASGQLNQLYTGLLPGKLNHPINIYNVGLAGELLTTMLSNLSSYTTLGVITGATNIMTLFGGSNDLAANASGATVYANLQTGCATIKSGGYKCVVVSPLPRNSGFSGGANATTFETNRQIVITSLKANWPTFADGFIDAGSNPIMGPQSAASDVTLYPDAIHPSQPLGTSYIADDFAKGLKLLLP